MKQWYALYVSLYPYASSNFINNRKNDQLLWEKSAITSYDYVGAMSYPSIQLDVISSLPTAISILVENCIIIMDDFNFS